MSYAPYLGLNGRVRGLRQPVMPTMAAQSQFLAPAPPFHSLAARRSCSAFEA
jgi:hypothetical protein